MKKKNWRLRRRTVFSRDTCWWPTRHHYLSKPGGGGGWGVSHTRTGPGRPPVVDRLCCLVVLILTSISILSSLFPVLLFSCQVVYLARGPLLQITFRLSVQNCDSPLMVSRQLSNIVPSPDGMCFAALCFLLASILFVLQRVTLCMCEDSGQKDGNMLENRRPLQIAFCRSHRRSKLALR